MTQKISISVPHDSGNIDIIRADDPADIRLNIRKDGKTDHYQWFFFRVVGAQGQLCQFTIENAAAASYPDGWKDYRAVVSYDLDNWGRTETDYQNGQLVIRHRPVTNSFYVAYFAAYSTERYRHFVARICASPTIRQIALGQTLDGEELDLLRIGEPAGGKPHLWVIGRQHPGESMGSWWMEGFLSRLLDGNDSAATALRERACISVVPLVNIDGVRRGHLRTNAAGADLNREWAEPSLERSPEVFHIRNAMDADGCDFFLDVHGDEAIANNFIAGGEGIPGWSPKHQERLDHFKSTLKALCPAFQTEEGYPVDPPGEANMKIAANAIAQRFDCLSMTLEMPFKDAKVQPNPQIGWAPGRCIDLGRMCLDTMLAALPGLR